MGKILLSHDYNTIVLESFPLYKRDYFKYYSKIVDDNRSDNPDIIEEFILAVNRWLDWYNSKLIEQFISSDGKGGYIFQQNQEKLVSLWSDYKIDVYVNKEFFEEHIKIIESLKNRYKVTTTNGKPEQNPITYLSDAFESISKYNFIMNLLVEKNYCQQNTFIWKDERKGKKGLIVAILKKLKLQGLDMPTKLTTPCRFNLTTLCRYVLTTPLLHS